jgi:5-methyltetrahydrofolate--homocysteine methyltransferase
MLRPYVAELSRVAECHISVHPNAGLPNEFGEYDLSPDDMAEQLGEWADAGFINVIGGCCGTSPDHIAAIAKVMSNKAPRPLPTIATSMKLSGLEPFNLIS